MPGTDLSVTMLQLMRGEGNWATLGMFASMEGRILSACDALLGCAPFWFRVRAAPPVRSPLALNFCCIENDLAFCCCNYSQTKIDCLSYARLMTLVCLQGQRWLQKHAMSLERIAAARTPSEMASAVAAIEESLAEAGIVSGPWLAHWQQRWRASIAAAPDMRAVLLHVAALQVRSC